MTDRAAHDVEGDTLDAARPTESAETTRRPYGRDNPTVDFDVLDADRFTYNTADYPSGTPSVPGSIKVPIPGLNIADTIAQAVRPSWLDIAPQLIDTSPLITAVAPLVESMKRVTEAHTSQITETFTRLTDVQSRWSNQWHKVRIRVARYRREAESSPHVWRLLRNLDAIASTDVWHLSAALDSVMAGRGVPESADLSPACLEWLHELADAVALAPAKSLIAQSRCSVAAQKTDRLATARVRRPCRARHRQKPPNPRCTPIAANAPNHCTHHPRHTYRRCGACVPALTPP